MRVIKSSEAAGSTQEIGATLLASQLPPPEPAPPFVDPEKLALQYQMEQLRTLVAEQERQLALYPQQMSDAVEQAEVSSFELGKREGLAQRDGLLLVLRQGVDNAVTVLSDNMQSLDRLAVGLAQEALEKVLGDAGERAGLIAQIIRSKTSAVEALAVLRVEVARSDFPESSNLADLQSLVDRPSLEIIASDSVQSGDCRIVLRLGELEVGLGQQWSLLKALLTDLSEPGR